MLPTDPKERKNIPMCRGLLDYFPDALAYIAVVSKVGNDQHNPGEPMHWDREKSTDHPDCLVRHLMDRGKIDEDRVLHSGKGSWRYLAILQQEIEDLGGLANALALLNGDTKCQKRINKNTITPLA